MGWGASKAALIGAVSGVAIAITLVATAPGASAKATYDSPYGYTRTWNAAMRLVRVDSGRKITEKDEANGYLLFDYSSPQSAKVSAGSLELVRGHDPEASVSVVVQLPQMPHYHEQVLLDALAAKMRREYGDPPTRKPPAPPKDLPDAGPNGDD